MSELAIELHSPQGSVLLHASESSRSAPHIVRARPGDVLTGELVLVARPDKALSINSKGIEFGFKGSALSSITTRQGGGKHSRTVTRYGGGDFIRVLLPPLPPNVPEHVFAPGSRSSWPFRFEIPLEAPASQEFHVGRDQEESGCTTNTYSGAAGSVTAKVVYEIVALGHVSGWFTRNLHASVTVLVDPLFAAGLPPEALQPLTMYQTLQVADHFHCLCFGSGEVCADVTVPRTGFSPADQAVLHVRIDNRSRSRIDKCVVQLQTLLTVCVRSGPVPLTQRHLNLLRIDLPLAVAPGSKHEFDVAVNLAEMRPEVMNEAFSTKNVIVVKLKSHGRSAPLKIGIPLANPCAPHGGAAAAMGAAPPLGPNGGSLGVPAQMPLLAGGSPQPDGVQPVPGGGALGVNAARMMEQQYGSAQPAMGQGAVNAPGQQQAYQQPQQQQPLSSQAYGQSGPAFVSPGGSGAGPEGQQNFSSAAAVPAGGSAPSGGSAPLSPGAAYNYVPPPAYVEQSERGGLMAQQEQQYQQPQSYAQQSAQSDLLIRSHADDPQLTIQPPVVAAQR